MSNRATSKRQTRRIERKAERRATGERRLRKVGYPRSRPHRGPQFHPHIEDCN